MMLLSDPPPPPHLTSSLAQITVNFNDMNDNEFKVWVAKVTSQIFMKDLKNKGAGDFLYMKTKVRTHLNSNSPRPTSAQLAPN